MNFIKDFFFFIYLFFFEIFKITEFYELHKAFCQWEHDKNTSYIYNLNAQMHIQSVDSSGGKDGCVVVSVSSVYCTQTNSSHFGRAAYCKHNRTI